MWLLRSSSFSAARRRKQNLAVEVDPNLRTLPGSEPSCMLHGGQPSWTLLPPAIAAAVGVPAGRRHGPLGGRCAASPICSSIRPQKLPMHALSQQQARLDMDCRVPGSLGLFGCRREGQAPEPAICVQNGPLCHLGLPVRPDGPLPLRGFLPSWQRLMHSSLNHSEQTDDPVLTSFTASSGMG